MTSPDELHDDEPRLCLVNPSHTLRTDEQNTCLACYARTRSHILEIVDLYATLPANLVTITPIRYDRGPQAVTMETALPGGDALAYLAHGNGGNGINASRRGDDTHRLDQHPSDPQSVAGVLADHEDDWRRIKNQSPADTNPTVTSASGYLLRHIRWASLEHPAFDVFANDMRRLRSRLLAATGTLEVPVRADATCFTCGGTLIQAWGDNGLADDRTCEDCATTYTPAQYVLAVRAELERQRDHQDQENISA